MARKDDGESAISLFSFQDIITSITGIMFLVVLLLMLMMISSTVQKVKAAPQTETSKQLQEELSQLKKKIEELKLSYQKIDDEINNLKKLSPEELARQKSELQQLIREKQQNLDRIETELLQKNIRQEQIQADYKQAKVKFDAQQKMLSELKTQLKELEAEVKERSKEEAQRAKVMKFVINPNTSKSPILLEIGKDELKVLDVKNKTAKKFPGEPPVSMVNFEPMLSSFSPDSEYFTIIVKPSAFKYANTMLEILKKYNFERGVEILPDDTTTLIEDVKP